MRVCAASTEGPVGRMRVTEEELLKPIVRVLQVGDSVPTWMRNARGQSEFLLKNVENQLKIN